MPALRKRSRMLPPILPRPTSPMCTVTSPDLWLVRPHAGCWGQPATALIVRQAGVPGPVVPASAGQPDGHEQVAVAVVVVALELRLARDHRRLGRDREREPGERGTQGTEAVQQERRV